MSGDGLSDIVRIRYGEVCYWPNLGYGRFGAKVTMDNAPVFESYDQFDPRRIRLADIDGSGTADIIYVGQDGISLHFNQSGNSWAAPYRLAQFPQVRQSSPRSQRPIWRETAPPASSGRRRSKPTATSRCATST